ncbi:MAG: hypothetical protein HN370_01450 [Phycisphaerales bacterium]|nr:hypothetical protein [Phycisphaerales bacterium]
MQKVNLGIQILLPATATKIPKVRIGGKPCNKSAVPATPTTAPKPTVLKPAPTKP